MIKSLLLIIAVCTDCFAAAVGIGSAGIRIPMRSAAIISFVGTLFLCLSVAFAGALKLVVPEEICSAVSFLLLLALGIFNLSRNFWRDIISRRAKKGNPAMMLFDGASADTDGSKSISAGEALVLSAALSADSLVTGVSAGLGAVNLPFLSVMTFFAGVIFVAAGERLGRKIVSALRINLGWLCGAVLIVLAFITTT